MACLDPSDFRPADYFRTGPYTHFYMDPLSVNQDGDTVVSWTYTYRDLGMDTEIQRTFLVRQADEPDNFWVRLKTQDDCEPLDVTTELRHFENAWVYVKEKGNLSSVCFSQLTE